MADTLVREIDLDPAADEMWFDTIFAMGKAAAEEGAYLNVQVRTTTTKRKLRVAGAPAAAEIKTKPEVWYYVETYTDYPADDANPSGRTIFRAHLIQATKPKDAEAAALADARTVRLPGAKKTGHFMTRRLTDKKAEAIRLQIEDGSWEGWRF